MRLGFAAKWKLDAGRPVEVVSLDDIGLLELLDHLQNLQSGQISVNEKRNTDQFEFVYFKLVQ